MKTIKCPKCNGTGRIKDEAQVGSKMKTLRLRYDLTLTSVARWMRFSHAFISDLEHGKRSWTKPLIEQYKDAVANLAQQQHE